MGIAMVNSRPHLYFPCLYFCHFFRHQSVAKLSVTWIALAAKANALLQNLNDVHCIYWALLCTPIPMATNVQLQVYFWPHFGHFAGFGDLGSDWISCSTGILNQQYCCFDSGRCENTELVHIWVSNSFHQSGKILECVSVDFCVHSPRWTMSNPYKALWIFALCSGNRKGPVQNGFPHCWKYRPVQSVLELEWTTFFIPHKEKSQPALSASVSCSQVTHTSFLHIAQPLVTRRTS